MDTKELTTAITLSSMAVAATLILIFLPNVELITFTCFIAGILFGWRVGIFTAALTATIFEIAVTAILGSSGIIFPFKVISYCIAALFGAFCGKYFWKLKRRDFMIMGAFVTLIFDILTTIGMLFILSQPLSSLPYYLLFGTPFYIVHQASNAIIFSFTRDIVIALDKVGLEAKTIIEAPQKVPSPAKPYITTT